MWKEIDECFELSGVGRAIGRCREYQDVGFHAGRDRVRDDWIGAPSKQRVGGEIDEIQDRSFNVLTGDVFEYAYKDLA